MLKVHERVMLDKKSSITCLMTRSKHYMLHDQVMETWSILRKHGGQTCQGMVWCDDA